MLGNSERQRRLEKAKRNANYREDVARATEPQIILMKQGFYGAQSRIESGNFSDSMAEMQPAVVEVGRLSNAARALEDAGFDIAASLTKFDAATPNARDGRNVFSHFDDYLLGIGKLQTDVGIPVTMFYERNSTSGTAVVMSNPNIRLDVGEFLKAGNHLADDLLSVLEFRRER